jgi:hypothetical protein
VLGPVRPSPERGRAAGSQSQLSQVLLGRCATGRAVELDNPAVEPSHGRGETAARTALPGDSLTRHGSPSRPQTTGGSRPSTLGSSHQHPETDPSYPSAGRTNPDQEAWVTTPPSRVRRLTSQRTRDDRRRVRRRAMTYRLGRNRHPSLTTTSRRGQQPTTRAAVTPSDEGGPRSVRIERRSRSARPSRGVTSLEQPRALRTRGSAGPLRLRSWATRPTAARSAPHRRRPAPEGTRRGRPRMPSASATAGTHPPVARHPGTGTTPWSMTAASSSPRPSPPGCWTV